MIRKILLLAPLGRLGFLIAAALGGGGLAGVNHLAPLASLLRLDASQWGCKLAALGCLHLLTQACIRRSEHLRVSPLVWSLPLLSLAVPLLLRPDWSWGPIAGLAGTAVALTLLSVLPGRHVALPPAKVLEL